MAYLEFISVSHVPHG